jgi:hypothetical protein
MSIADKMDPQKSTIPDAVQIKLLQRRLADTIKYFKELQALYEASTGIHWVPADLIPDDVTEVTPADAAFLADLGISL